MIVVTRQAETGDGGVVLAKSTKSFASEKQCFAGDVCQTKQCRDELGCCVLKDLKRGLLGSMVLPGATSKARG